MRGDDPRQPVAGWGRILAVNVFALIVARIEALTQVADPVGPDNDAQIIAALAEADPVVAGWGRLAKLPLVHRDRWRSAVAAAERVSKPLHCLAVTRDGHPHHPLYLRRGARLSRWVPPDRLVVTCDSRDAAWRSDPRRRRTELRVDSRRKRQ
jgi:hypothetical protein